MAFAAAAAAAAVNFLAFGASYGDISSLMQYGHAIQPDIGQVLINLLAMLAVIAAAWLLVRKKPGLLRAVFAACCAALVVLSVMNVSAIRRDYRETETQAEQIRDQTREHAPEIHLSKTGRNVMIIMLDRAVGGFVPYLLNEKQELREQFDGFTWYANTLSFGFHTNVGSPPLYGGYE